MGYALAQAAYEAGAKTVLISGPVNQIPEAGIELCSVESAEQMNEVALREAQDADVFIGAAAVADYRPADVASQ